MEQVVKHYIITLSSEGGNYITVIRPLQSLYVMINHNLAEMTKADFSLLSDAYKVSKIS